MNLELYINIQKKEVQRLLKLIQRVFKNFRTISWLARPAFFRFSNVTEFSLKKNNYAQYKGECRNINTIVRRERRK